MKTVSSNTSPNPVRDYREALEAELLSLNGRPVSQSRRKGLELTTRNSAETKIREESTKVFSVVPEAAATPTIIWPAPEPITHGEQLTAVQLNATANVAGSIAFTPCIGYVLPAGTHSLWVTFTPAESINSAPVQTSVSILVRKADPALSWRAPCAITTGDTLDGTQLNATAQIAGRFDYSPAQGDLLAPGIHTLSVTFTPDDLANYESAHASVSLTVMGEKPPVEWPNPEPIHYGTLLSQKQLCASSAVEGRFEYHPSRGAMLAAGDHHLSVEFIPTDTIRYSATRTSVPLRVEKLEPVVNWPPPEPICSGSALSTDQLNATATVPGSFSYTPGVGERLSPGEHTISATFTPADTVNFSSARAFVTLTVTEKFPSVIDWPKPDAICYGAELSDSQLNAVASVPGTLIYTPEAGHILAPGKYALRVSFEPLDGETYTAAQATVELEVKSLPEMVSLVSAAIDTPIPEAFTASESPLPVAVLAKAAGIGSDETKPTETRIYKGAVYVKGADRQWHLQQK